MAAILHKLQGGDRRSIGKSNAVVADIIADPRRFDAVFSGLQSADLIVRARAADVIEKVTRGHPEYLHAHKKMLLGPLAHLDQKEVRWHVAQMLPRVRWNKAERQKAMGILTDYLSDPSSIVKTFAMQALADFARQYPVLMPVALIHLQELTVTGTPAMKARGRRLLAGMNYLNSAPKSRSRR